MGERWVGHRLGKDETLRCDSCFNYLHDQKVHFYLNDDGAMTNEVICDACWKEDQKEEKKRDE
jgi:hypothetical protein